jgi:dTDP-4-dehydrorhamnose reductase
MLLCYSLKTGKGLFLRSWESNTAAGKISCNSRQPERLWWLVKNAVACVVLCHHITKLDGYASEKCYLLWMKLTYKQKNSLSCVCASLDKWIIYYSTICPKIVFPSTERWRESHTVNPLKTKRICFI